MGLAQYAGMYRPEEEARRLSLRKNELGRLARATAFGALLALGESRRELDVALARVEEAPDSLDADSGAAWVARGPRPRPQDVRFELKERASSSNLSTISGSRSAVVSSSTGSREILLRSISLTNSRSGSLHLFDGRATSFALVRRGAPERGGCRQDRARFRRADQQRRARRFQPPASS